MLRLLIVVPLIAVSLMAYGGGYSLKALVGEMPDTLFPYLSRNNKLDMVDFMESGMKAEVNNIFGGMSEMTVLTDSFCAITLNEAVTVEMRLLDYDGQHKASELKADSALALAFNTGCLICMVTTYGRQPVVSDVAFYTIGWNRLDNIPNPTASIDTSELIERGDSLDDNTFDNLMAQYQDVSVVAHLSPDDSSLTFAPVLPLLPNDMEDAFERCKRLICLKWCGDVYKNN